MDFSFGTLELTPSPAAPAAGDPSAPAAPAARSAGAAARPAPARGTGRRGAFESYVLDAVEKMNARQLEVSSLQERLIADPDSVDIQDVTIAMAQAEMSLTLAQTVIDRLVNAWTDLAFMM